MAVEMLFDGSLQHKTSGACFQIIARDQRHAQQIATWLRSLSVDEPVLSAYVVLEPQRVGIEV